MGKITIEVKINTFGTMKHPNKALSQQNRNKNVHDLNIINLRK